jgi:L-asparagine transporter-like permease
VTIVGVTAGHIDPVTQAVNKAAQQVLIAFVCLYVSFSFSVFDAFIYFFIDISLSSLSLGDLSYG